MTLNDLPPKWGLIEVNAKGHIKVKTGHVHLKHGELDDWQHSHNHMAEISTLAMCLNRVADPQKVQDRIRAMSNQVTKLTKQNEAIKKDNAKLSQEVFRLKMEACQFKT